VAGLNWKRIGNRKRRQGIEDVKGKTLTTKQLSTNPSTVKSNVVVKR
jgi:hypothetical protein